MPNRIIPPIEPGPSISVAGRAIDDKYTRLGRQAGFLGLPKTSIQLCPDGIGFFVEYQGGSIFWNPSTGAHEVHGAIRDKWAMFGGERSFLGYPLTDETGAPNGVGRFNHFQGGSIYWTPSTGAHEVHGAIRDKWASMGWERSFLGYPLTDETPTPDGVGRFNHFQGGSIYWTSSTGAHEVHGAIRDKWASMGWERSFLRYPVTDEMDAQVPVIAVPPSFVTGRVSEFQDGQIMWSEKTGALVSGEVKQFRADVTTQDWAPIGGWVDVVVNAQGHVTFQGHLHNSGLPNIDFALAVVITTPSGNVYGLPPKQGHVDGTITLLGRNRDYDWIDSGVNPPIAENWDQITQGSLFWRLVAQDTLSQGPQRLLEDLAQDAAKAGLKSLVNLILG